MILTMSRDADGDGAWGTVLNRLQGFTFVFTLRDGEEEVGRILEADHDGYTVTVMVNDFDQPRVGEKERVLTIEDIVEMEYP